MTVEIVAFTKTVSCSVGSPCGTISYLWDIDASTDLVVESIDTNDVATTLVENVDYTHDMSAGQITLVSPPTSGSVRLTRSTALTQETEYENHEALNVERLEKDFDKMIMIAQEIQDSLDDLADVYTSATNGSYIQLKLPNDSYQLTTRLWLCDDDDDVITITGAWGDMAYSKGQDNLFYWDEVNTQWNGFPGNKYDNTTDADQVGHKEGTLINVAGEQEAIINGARVPSPIRLEFVDETAMVAAKSYLKDGMECVCHPSTDQPNKYTFYNSKFYPHGGNYYTSLTEIATADYQRWAGLMVTYGTAPSSLKIGVWDGSTSWLSVTPT